MDQQYCTVCHLPLTAAWYFCPNCGKKVHEPPLSVSMGKQISVYALSVLLPPMGLWPGVKYLQQADPKAKQIGWIAIILTVLSFLITGWLTIRFVQNLQDQMSVQMQQYQGF